MTGKEVSLLMDELHRIHRRKESPCGLPLHLYRSCSHRADQRTEPCLDHRRYPERSDEYPEPDRGSASVRDHREGYEKVYQ